MFKKKENLQNVKLKMLETWMKKGDDDTSTILVQKFMDENVLNFTWLKLWIKD